MAIKTKANEDALRSELKVMSLVDAFNPDAVAKPEANRRSRSNWLK